VVGGKGSMSTNKLRRIFERENERRRGEGKGFALSTADLKEYNLLEVWERKRKRIKEDSKPNLGGETGPRGEKGPEAPSAPELHKY